MFLGWLPIIGPIIDGIVSIVKGHQNLEAIKYKTDGTVDIEGLKTSVALQNTINDDICLRFLRDITLAGPVAWSAIISWDTIVAFHNPELMYIVAPFPASVSYLPYAAITFLLGNIGLIYWKRSR